MTGRVRTDCCGFPVARSRNFQSFDVVIVFQCPASYRYKYTSGDLAEMKRLAHGSSQQRDAYFLFNNVSMYEEALAFQSVLKDL
jgi:uncharacterized protein YecE (DUF72 family)